MDVKLLLLMNCLYVIYCQSTISNRNDPTTDCELFEYAKFEIETIRQLLMNLQKPAFRNEMPALLEMKSQVEEIHLMALKQQHCNATQAIQEVTSQVEKFHQIALRQQNCNATQAIQETKSQVEEIHKNVFKLQHRNESQTMQQMKSQIEEIRQIALRQQNCNATQAIQEVKSQVEEFHQIALRQQNCNATQAIQETKLQVQEIRQVVLKLQHRNETHAIQMMLKIEEISQIVFKLQHRNESQTIQQMKTQIEEIRRIALNLQQRTETQTIQQMKSQVEEIRQFVLLLKQQNRPRAACPPGFNYLPETDSCFKVIFEKMSWDSATERCRQVMPGVHLAAITSQAENDAITRYLQSQFRGGTNNCISDRFPVDGNLIWIGGQTKNPRLCDGPYVWKPLKGIEIPFSYTNWGRGSPDCYEDKENCVQIKTGLNYIWNDYPCNFVSCPICEIHV